MSRSGLCDVAHGGQPPACGLPRDIEKTKEAGDTA